MVKQQIANPEQKAPLNPQLVIFIGILGISCSSIFIKLATAPALITAFYRLFFTVIILTPFFLRLIFPNVLIKMNGPAGNLVQKGWVDATNADSKEDIYEIKITETGLFFTYRDNKSGYSRYCARN